MIEQGTIRRNGAIVGSGDLTTIYDSFVTSILSLFDKYICISSELQSVH